MTPLTNLACTALIAEDEPLLAAHLEAELARLWPALRVLANVRHGEAVLQQGLALQPELMFLDIRMPGMSGLEAARALAEDWPDPSAAGKPFPVIVFVTAYDQYAVQAFELAAVDYVLKPVQPERLAQTCKRVQAALAQRRQPAAGTAPDAALDAALNTALNSALNTAVTQLRGLLAAPPTAPAALPLRVIQAGAGNAVHLIPVGEVLYFEAADKYVRVITAEREHLIRLSLRELLPQLDAQRFWQVHRGTVVRCDAIATATRDDSGKFTLTLRGHADRLPVSRLYTHLFKAM